MKAFLNPLLLVKIGTVAIVIGEIESLFFLPGIGSSGG